MVLLETLRRIAEIEFSDVIAASGMVGGKLRLWLMDDSYMDVHLSEKIKGRCGFHWERGHIDGTLFRYDNFPDTNWRHVPTFPYHFHNGSQSNVENAPFDRDIVQGFRQFLTFVREHLSNAGK